MLSDFSGGLSAPGMELLERARERVLVAAGGE
jgi:hypothetical protein